MRRPLAATHVARVIQMTSLGSLAREVADGRVVLRAPGAPDELVLAALRELAREDKVLEEEARALARARSWPETLAGTSYAWARLAGDAATEALPRILRIYDREIFELDQDMREPHEDEEVRSLVAATLDARRSVFRALSALVPQATLPGAK